MQVGEFWEMYNLYPSQDRKDFHHPSASVHQHWFLTVGGVAGL